jgi:uroporphyrinogen decarboxylase
MKTMTPKQRLEMILCGQVPDVPPHWEMVFQIEKAMWGMDGEDLKGPDRLDFQVDVFRRLAQEFDWAAVNGGYDIDSLRHIHKALGSELLIAAFEGEGVFWMPTGDQMMDFVVQLYEHPETMHQQARKKCDKAKQFFKEAVDVGADFFVLTYDFGFNTAPFVSPDQFRQFIAPYLAELAQAIHNLGKKAILHSDGCILQILDQIYATGVDGYQSIDPQGHMDIQQVRRDYPDWILMGNVACNMLQDVNEPEIVKSVQYCMQHGGIGKPYIFSTSNCIFHGMPVESYRMMFREYKRLIAGRFC